MSMLTGEYERDFEFEWNGEESEDEGYCSPRRRRRGRQFEGEEAEFEGEDEDEAVDAFLRLSNEGELDRFLPLLAGPILGALKGLAPMVMSSVVPVLRRIGTRVLANVASRAAPAPPRQQQQPPEQEDFLFGKLLGNLFREQEQEQEQEHYPWRYRHRRHRNYASYWNPWANRQYGYDIEPEGEQEAFLGTLLGKLLGELEGMDPDSARLATGRWYVRFARQTAHDAADAIAAMASRGAPVTSSAVRRIVFEAVQRAAGAASPAAAARGGCSTHSPEPGSSASGTWVRRGTKLIINL